MRGNKIDAVELAWPEGDNPKASGFNVCIAHEQQDEIVHILRGAGFSVSAQPRVRALQSGRSLAGRYQVRLKRQHLFLRISARTGNAQLEQGILAHLAHRGLVINPILATSRVESKGRRLRADIRPFIFGRYYRGSKADIHSLAETLGRLHRSLKEYPDAPRVRSLAQQRYLRFQMMRERIAADLSSGRLDIFHEHAAWASENLITIRGMIDEFNPRFDLQDNAQCIHGEVHPANVIFDDRTPVLIDFEEAPHTYAPPAYDLAFFVQRFLMRDHPDEDILTERLAMTEAAYGAPLPPLAETMIQICRLSMVYIIHARAYENLTTPFSEYAKFVALEKQARHYAGLQ